jgi:ADP-heptose:LPS heptosyltransferase
MLDRSILVDEVSGRHEVERVFALARVFGVTSPIPPLTVVPDPADLAAARAVFGDKEAKIAVHISARRPTQRWPAERFAALIGRLQERYKVILLWSPGSAADAEHPGDDEKAKVILSIVKNTARLIAYRTETLQGLIAGLAACDAVICSDGGASHIAAALGKPMVCFFGDSPVERWRPWGVPLRVIQPATKNVADISVEEALIAFASVAADTGVLRHPAP